MSVVLWWFLVGFGPVVFMFFFFFFIVFMYFWLGYYLVVDFPPSGTCTFDQDFFFLIFNLLIITMKAGDLKVDFFVGNIVIYFTKLLTYYFTIYYNKKLLLIIVLESRFDFGVQNLYKLCMCMKHNIFFVCIYIYIYIYK